MNRWHRLLRLLRTLWYVPPRAVLWRVWARLKCFYYESPLYGISTLQGELNLEIDWVGVELIAGDVEAGKALAKGHFMFAGRAVELGLPPKSWLPERVSALWVFHLHYHEWLADLRAAGKRTEARALVGDWLVRFGSYQRVAWHPYPTSLRLVAWLTHGKWLLEGAEEDFTSAFGDALWRQAVYVQDNCEWDLGGNHLLKNLKAMIYCGLSLPGQGEMLERGLAELVRQVEHQVLADGGHFELSPYYMAQVLRDLIEVRAVLRRAKMPQNKVLERAVGRLGTALHTLRMPDGGLALFNDGAELESGYVDALVRLSGADEPLEVLPDCGYARLERGKTVVLFDAGKVGPDENPGHAHADTLSFEMAVGRERVVVNGGTYAYQDRLRNILRGTAAHSTVEVGGEDLAEVWGVFRVGRRPRVVTMAVRGEEMAEMVAEGGHDGYRHLGVHHGRKMVLAGDGSRLRGEDVLTGTAGLRCLAHFHIHPDVRVRLLGESEAELVLASGKKLRFKTEGGRLDVKESRYAPQFGVLRETKQLVLHGRLTGGRCVLGWQVLIA